MADDFDFGFSAVSTEEFKKTQKIWTSKKNEILNTK